MILNNCRLIPELSGGIAAECGSVIVENGKILKVNGAPLTGADADGQEVIDCEGKTLLPGLIDMHTHITMLGNVGMDCVDEPMRILIGAAEQAQKCLKYGFTTIRDCGSVRAAAVYARDIINKGLVFGPNVLACGETLMSSVVNKNGSLASIIHFADGAEEFRKGVREAAGLCVDFIKIYASGSAYNPTGVPLNPIMTEDEIRTAVETAQANGLNVASHCHADKAIRDCIECGVKTIEHATYLSDETINLLLQTEDCYLIPTLAAMYVSQTDPAEREFWLARLTPMLENCAGQLEKVYKAGAKMGFGTDSAPGSVQYEKGVEFQMRKDYCHMENVDILLQATKYNAEIAGIHHMVGEIKEGLLADLILVDGNPAEDLSVMYGKPEKVFKSGRLV